MFRRTLLALPALLILSLVAPAFTADEVELVFSGSGQTQGKYNFSWNHTVKVPADKLAKGGEDALKAIFEGAEVKGDDSKIAKASGSFKIEEGKVTGKVKLEWKVQGNPKVIEADLEGTASVGTGETKTALKFEAKNVKVSGSWNWGGGSAAVTGKASFKVESK